MKDWKNVLAIGAFGCAVISTVYQIYTQRKIAKAYETSAEEIVNSFKENCSE